jgi:HK97 family phage prohead protease
VESVSRGDIGGMSFAFRALEDEWRIDERGMPIREVLDATLSEVSVVCFPAYPQTTISAGPEPLGGSVDFARRQLQTLLAR